MPSQYNANTNGKQAWLYLPIRNHYFISQCHMLLTAAHEAFTIPIKRLTPQQMLNSANVDFKEHMQNKMLLINNNKLHWTAWVYFGLQELSAMSMRLYEIIVQARWKIALPFSNRSAAQAASAFGCNPQAIEL